MIIKYFLGQNGKEIEFIPMGRSLQRGKVEVARQGRTASGRLVKDVIANKEKFTFSYTDMTQNLYNEIDAEVLRNQDLNFYYINIDGSKKEFAVRAAELQGTLKGNGWYENVSFVLEEV